MRYGFDRRGVTESIQESRERTQERKELCEVIHVLLEWTKKSVGALECKEGIS
jgi:hypothetical protein